MITASFPLLLFVFAGLFSPGPNVVLLTSSGARFGFRATIPHLLGVPLGTGVLAALSGLGVGAALLAAPGLKLVFQLLAAVWILWLSWKMARVARVGRTADRGRPFTFLQAVAFQVVNPKIWAVTIAASAGFGIGLSPGAEALRLFVAFAALNLAVCLFWTALGQLLAQLLTSDRIWRRFMTGMALIMAATVFMIFL